jgi:hypothetical protein
MHPAINLFSFINLLLLLGAFAKPLRALSHRSYKTLSTQQEIKQLSFAIDALSLQKNYSGYTPSQIFPSLDRSLPQQNNAYR